MHVSTFVLRQRSFPQSTALQSCNITEAYQECSSSVHFVTFLLLSVSLSLPMHYWAPYPDCNMCNVLVYQLGTVFLLTICAMFLYTTWVLYSCSQSMWCSCVLLSTISWLQSVWCSPALLLPFLSTIPSYDISALSTFMLLCFMLYTFTLLCVFALLGHIMLLCSLVKWPCSLGLQLFSLHLQKIHI